MKSWVRFQAEKTNFFLKLHTFISVPQVHLRIISRKSFNLIYHGREKKSFTTENFHLEPPLGSRSLSLREAIMSLPSKSCYSTCFMGRKVTSLWYNGQCSCSFLKRCWVRFWVVTENFYFKSSPLHNIDKVSWFDVPLSEKKYHPSLQLPALFW